LVARSDSKPRGGEAVTARKKDALDSLLEHCDAIVFTPTWARSRSTHAKTRRLVRALLKERAEQASDATYAVYGWQMDEMRTRIHAAVLSRPARRKGA
jgi:hypothetical protein